MFENEKVKHVKFGTGNVIECDGVHIKVVFDLEHMEKTFSYPGIFESFLNFENAEAQQQASESLNAKKSDEARMNNIKRLLYLEAEKKRKNEKLAKTKRK